MRHEYRVTKYNPKFRNALGPYKPVEWTFFAQVGKRVGGRVLTMAQYLRTEAKYLQVLEAMLREADIRELEARGFRAKSRRPARVRARTVTVSQAIRLARLALRERLDGILVVPWRAYVHFGWDYYLYVGLSRPTPEALGVARSLGLFVERCPSPHQRRRRLDRN